LMQLTAEWHTSGHCGNWTSCFGKAFQNQNLLTSG